MVTFSRHKPLVVSEYKLSECETRYLSGIAEYIFGIKKHPDTKSIFDVLIYGDGKAATKMPDRLELGDIVRYVNKKGMKIDCKS